jgi:hypothetical protein
MKVSFRRVWFKIPNKNHETNFQIQLPKYIFNALNSGQTLFQ